MRKNEFKFILLIALLVGVVYLNLTIGSSRISALEIFRVMFTHGGDAVSSKIIWGIRIPRIFAALILGGALSLSGYLLQTFFNNPIAGPFVLGISSGAKLMVAILMVVSLELGYSMSGIMMVLAALLGSIVATVFVLGAASKVRSMSILIVCGIMIGYICSAITELLVNFADDSNIVNLHNWSMGSFSATSMKDVYTFGFIVFLTFLITLFMTKKISVYSYGEAYAHSLGINIKTFRISLILISSILSATVTAFAGPISFVGIAVPHIIRSLFKTNEPKIMITASFLGGAVFCLFCDLLARTLMAPVELSISTVTAILGAPVVISMMLKRRAY